MTKKQPLVSVIVPIYNVKKYLEQCLESIVNQTYDNLEIILVDDGSTDGSGEMVDNYGKKNRNVKVIHKRNSGLSSARNTGIKYAGGEWLVFIDSDDYVDKDFITKLYRLAENNGADIATCNFKAFSSDGARLKKSPDWLEKSMSGFDAVVDMLTQKRPAYICLGIYRMSLFKKHDISFPEGRTYEDIAPRLELLYFAKKVIYSNDCLYFYRIRKDSITGTYFSTKKYHDYIAALDDARNFLRNTKKAVGMGYINYFEFSSLITLLGYLAREQSCKGKDMIYWNNVRKRMSKLFKEADFPNFRTKLLGMMVIIISLNKATYSAIYRRIKI